MYCHWLPLLQHYCFTTNFSNNYTSLKLLPQSFYISILLRGLDTQPQLLIAFFSGCFTMLSVFDVAAASCDLQMKAEEKVSSVLFFPDLMCDHGTTYHCWGYFFFLLMVVSIRCFSVYLALSQREQKNLASFTSNNWNDPGLNPGTRFFSHRLSRLNCVPAELSALMTPETGNRFKWVWREPRCVVSGPPMFGARWVTVTSGGAWRRPSFVAAQYVCASRHCPKDRASSCLWCAPSI